MTLDDTKRKPFRFGDIESQLPYVLSETKIKSDQYYNKTCLFTMYRGNLVSDYLDLKEERQKLRSLDEIASCWWAVNYPNRLTQIIREREREYSFVGEGEIKTWPTKMLLRDFVKFCKSRLDKRLFNLTPAELGMKKYASIDKPLVQMNFFNPMYFGQEVIPLVTVMLPFFEIDLEKVEQMARDMSNDFFRTGYNFSSFDVVPENDASCQIDGKKVRVAAIQFEAKFLENPTQIGSNLCHITTLRRLPKILKNGLVPKESSQTKYAHVPRIYLFNDCTLEFVKRFAGERHPNDIICCIKIDVEKLKNSDGYRTGKTLFYIDPVFGLNGKTSALFTTKNISPNLLEDKVLCCQIVDGQPQRSWSVSMKDVTQDYLENHYNQLAQNTNESS